MVARYGYRSESGEIIEDSKDINYNTVIFPHNDSPFCPNCPIPERKMVLKNNKWLCLECGSEFNLNAVEKEDLMLEDGKIIERLID